MSTSVVAAAPATGVHTAGLTSTERNWLVAVGLGVLSLGLVGAWEAVERDVLAMPASSTFDFARSVGEKSARLLGIAHFLVAFLFLGTSRRLRNRSALGRLALLGGLAAVLCTSYAGLHSLVPGLASAMFISLFLVHDLRDQVYFYHANGDVRADTGRRELDSALFRVPVVMIAGGAALAAVLLAAGLVEANRSREVADLRHGVPWFAGLFFLVLASAVIAEAARLWRRTHLGPRELWRRHRPAVLVLVGTVTLLLFSAAVTAKAHWIVIVHVTAWYVFTMAQLGRREAQPGGVRPRAGTWAWWRGTRAGFSALHGIALGLVVALVAVWAYGFGWSSSSPLAWLVSREAFPLWTIAHVTVSFLPR